MPVAEGSILTDDFLRELMNVGEVDILVGVSTHNDAATVAHSLQCIRDGLLKYFPRQRAVIINADRGSRDGTQDLVRAASISDMRHVANPQALRTLHSISTRYEGGSSTGTAFHTFLEAADLLHANACAVISPDSTNIAPDWMELLLRPVIREKFDLVAPLYRRHKFDGLLVRNLIYPVTRALFSESVREPYPTDFAFSGKLAGNLLTQDIWTQDAAMAGVELFMALTALCGSFNVAQVYLGDKMRTEHASSELIPAMRQTVGVLFWWMDAHADSWRATLNPHPVITVGEEPRVTLDPVRVNRKRIHQLFTVGLTELEPVLSSILDHATLQELKRNAAVPEEDFRFSDELWAHTVYEFAAAYHKSLISRDHIVQALAPLYRGKTFTFLSENRDADEEQVERSIENLCVEFERAKPHLLDLWNGKK